jgi:hypothetical protein
MGCNCKRVKSFEEKYGVPEYETVNAKIYRNFLRVVLFAIAVVLAIVLTPVLIFVTIYKLTFGKDNKITLPKFMRKYLE